MNIPRIPPAYTFSLLLELGVALGLYWSARRLYNVPKHARQQLDGETIALAGSLIGGRTAYVTVYWTYFHQHPLEIPQVWLGGMSWPGALAGALLALPIAARLVKTPTGLLADNLLPLLTSMTASTWLACWMTGYAYGVDVDAWWGIPARDEWGRITTRWPTQLLGAFLVLGIHWGVDRLRVRGWLQVPGLAASLGVCGLSLTILALSPFRADPAPIWNSLRLDTWAAPAFALLAGFSLLLTTKQPVISQRLLGEASEVRERQVDRQNQPENGHKS